MARKMPAMPQTVRLPLWFLLLNVELLLGAFMLGVWQGNALRGLPAEEAAILRLTHRQVLEHHVDAQDPRDLLHEAIGGMVGNLDRYSAYIPPARVRQFEEDTTGRYEGVGILLAPATAPITVLFPLAGGPAERAGMQVGDRILAIDGEDMTGIPVEVLSSEARSRLKGPAGGSVVLAVERQGEALEVELERGPVQKASVKWGRMLDEGAGIGYLHVSDFQKRTAAEFDAGIASLAAGRPDGLAALVLDLRFNPGGILEECVALTNRFLAAGTIVSLKRRTSEILEVHEADPELCTLPDLPLVLLVNGQSASASEVLAGALKDHGRAVLVGEQTYGKGFVQSIYRWRDLDFRLKLTTAQYYTPGGHRIERREGGLQPDRKVGLEAAEAHRLQRLLAQLEPPETYREAARALAEDLGFPLQEPPPPDQDPQLAAALEAARETLR